MRFYAVCCLEVESAESVYFGRISVTKSLAQMAVAVFGNEV